MVKSIRLDLLPMLRWDRRSDVNFDVKLLGRRRRALEWWLVRLERSYTRNGAREALLWTRIEIHRSAVPMVERLIWSHRHRHLWTVAIRLWWCD